MHDVPEDVRDGDGVILVFAHRAPLVGVFQGITAFLAKYVLTCATRDGLVEQLIADGALEVLGDLPICVASLLYVRFYDRVLLYNRFQSVFDVICNFY